jgi:hypothetical protein
MLKVMMWVMLLLPWISLLFMKKGGVKRYMPVALFAAILVMLDCELGFTYQWWKINIAIFPAFQTNFAFVFGPFMAGTIWIFYLTFRKFWLYLATNVVIDALFAFPLSSWFQKLGVYRLINFNNWYVLVTSVSFALLIYVYQLWQGGIMEKPHTGGEFPTAIDISSKWPRRQKAR